MYSTNEGGNAKNVALFETLVTSCTNFGSAYNPSADKLKISSLNVILLGAKDAIALVESLKVDWEAAIDARNIIFEPLKKLSTRIINSLASCGASLGTIEHARNYNRKLQNGSRIKKATNTSGEGGATEGGEDTSAGNSRSQQSIDNLIQHFSGIVTTVANEPNYTPNEYGLKVPQLQALLENMKAVNTTVVEAAIVLDNARGERDKILYKPHTGLVPIANEVKPYVLSVFGRDSKQYKQLTKLKFKVPDNLHFAIVEATPPAS